MLAQSPPLLEFAEFDEADTGDGFDFAKGFDGGVGRGGVGDVDLHNGERLTLWDSLRAGGPAESEVGDVDRVFAEDGPDAAYYTGDVVVADSDERSSERRLDVDAVVSQQARRSSVQHRRRRAGVAF